MSSFFVPFYRGTVTSHSWTSHISLEKTAHLRWMGVQSLSVLGLDKVSSEARPSRSIFADQVICFAIDASAHFECGFIKGLSKTNKEQTFVDVVYF